MENTVRRILQQGTWSLKVSNHEPAMLLQTINAHMKASRLPEREKLPYFVSKNLKTCLEKQEKETLGTFEKARGGGEYHRMTKNVCNQLKWDPELFKAVENGFKEVIGMNVVMNASSKQDRIMTPPGNIVYKLCLNKFEDGKPSHPEFFHSLLDLWKLGVVPFTLQHGVGIYLPTAVGMDSIMDEELEDFKKLNMVLNKIDYHHH